MTAIEETPAPVRQAPKGGETAIGLSRGSRRTITRRFAAGAQRLYVRSKLAGDPLYAAVASRLATAAPLPLLDVGCGLGLLGQYLHAVGVLHGYLGIDHDERKIAAARHAAAALGGALRFQHGDVDSLGEFAGHVALLDVLHYLPAWRQPLLLQRLAQRVAPDGLLLLRNVLRQRHWRYHATVLEEQCLYYSGWMRVRPTHYPAAEEIAAPLRAAGLHVHMEPLWGRTPFNSYLVVARRPADAAQGDEAQRS
ncbi:MAG: class I SAM-dependent methyltransferase [Fulvimonas sp.]|nr:class I SAM-dependent methyltransferase [Fulvimonas sp.]